MIFKNLILARRWILVILALFTSANSATSQNALECVDPTILAAFLTSANESTLPVISQSPFPQQFDGLDTINEIKYVGGRTQGGPYGNSFAFHSTLPVSQMAELIVTGLRSRGWNVLLNRTSSTEFSPNHHGWLSGDLCSNDNGQFRLTVRPFGDATFANISMVRGGDIDCDGEVTEGWSFLRISQSVLPDLEVPAGAKIVQTKGQGWFSRGWLGAMSAATQMSFSANQTPAAVAEHFADQISKQGWRIDSQWGGEISVGSNWVRVVEGHLLHGQLSLIITNDEFGARFEIRPGSNQ